MTIKKEGEIKNGGSVKKNNMGRGGGLLFGTGEYHSFLRASLHESDFWMGLKEIYQINLAG